MKSFCEGFSILFFTKNVKLDRPVAFPIGVTIIFIRHSKIVNVYTYFVSILAKIGMNYQQKLWSGGELLELRLLDTHLLDTFGSKSIARHKFYHLLESS